MGTRSSQDNRNEREQPYFEYVKLHYFQMVISLSFFSKREEIAPLDEKTRDLIPMLTCLLLSATLAFLS